MPDSKKADKKLADGVDQNHDKEPDVDAMGLGLNEERDAIYGKFYGEEGDAVDSDDQDQTPTDDDSGDDDHDTDRDDTDKVDTDDEESDQVKGDSDDDQDQKMVPLAALHEERKRRQEQASEIKSREERIETLESRVEQLLNDNNKLLDRLTTRDDDGDSGEYDNDELDEHDRAVLKDLKELKEYKQKAEAERARQQQEETRTKFQKNVKKVSDELAEEGYLGFEDFGVPLVADRLRVKIAELGEKKALEKYDNLDGWKVLYKEEVWPNVSKKLRISLVKNEEDNEEKIRKKKGARLPNKPNAPRTTPKDDDSNLTQEEMYSDYMKRRRSQLFD